MSLLEDLVVAQKKAAGERECPMCLAIEEVPAGVLRDMLADAAAGTIGYNTLVEVLRKNEIRDPRNGQAIGRRTLEGHRNERHEP